MIGWFFHFCLRLLAIACDSIFFYFLSFESARTSSTPTTSPVKTYLQKNCEKMTVNTKVDCKKETYTSISV